MSADRAPTRLNTTALTTTWWKLDVAMLRTMLLSGSCWFFLTFVRPLKVGVHETYTVGGEGPWVVS
jgi:hypothetical protein